MGIKEDLDIIEGAYADMRARLQCERQGFAHRGYQINDDVFLWRFGELSWPAESSPELMDEEKKGLRSPFVEIGNIICRPFSTLGEGSLHSSVTDDLEAGKVHLQEHYKRLGEIISGN